MTKISVRELKIELTKNGEKKKTKVNTSKSAKIVSPGNNSESYREILF